MARLKNTHELKEDIDNIENGILKTAILKWVDKNEVHGVDGRFSNLYFRCNLSYILDNINDNGLIDELQSSMEV